MLEKQTLYFKNASEWRAWLHENHDKHKAVYLIFYKVAHEAESMRWEEAVKVAICYGWIDSTVRKLDEHRRQQLFTPRKDKSIWSKINKGYIEDLIAANLMHESGLKKIETAKKNGSWKSLDAVENLEIPEDLQQAFAKNPVAFSNYENFSKSYKKNYLYWVSQAKRPETRQSRITQVIDLCERNCKMRG
ncbi:YdeI/OmpD-associated family protein [Flavobacterium sp. FZUC8N2.13]|uniref:YdeI/OmpD-associated family protein n=1 Tax=Flavobacterium zubiriense TaxID=3138075 RepID=A0ABV4T879_9FLAO